MLVLSHHPIPYHDPRPAENIEKSTQSPERGSYDLYRPSVEDNPQFVDMLPPPQTQEEPDYYAVKPKKTKKYSANDEKEKKYKKFENLKAKIVKLDDYDEAELNQEANDYPAEESSTQSSEESARTQRETDSEDAEETSEGDAKETAEGDAKEASEGEQENSEEIEAAEATDSSIETSAPSTRLDFHMNGN